MAKPPTGYSVSKGAYFNADGQGPYAWDGSTMALVGSSSSIALGGGSDMTAATVGTFGVDTYTAGAQWVITYNGSGIPLTEYLLGDVSLSSTLVSAGGGIYYVGSGLAHVSGALQMTLAQFNTWTALTPTVKPGFRVFITDVGSFTNAAGTTTVPGAFRTYHGPNMGWRWDNRVKYENFQTVTTSSASEVSFRTVTLPVGLLTDYTHIRMRSSHGLPTGAGQVVAYNLGGTAFYSATFGGGGAGNEFQMVKERWSRGPSSQFNAALTTVGSFTGAQQVNLTSAVNYLTTAVVADFRGSGGSVPVTHSLLWSSVEVFEHSAAY